MSDTRQVLLVMDFQHGIVERIGDPSVVAESNLAFCFFSLLVAEQVG
jgi:hypothetical protein